MLDGHDHDYERFAPQTADGRPDAALGIREFVVGTGGKSHDLFSWTAANSEVRNWTAYGALFLTLHPGSYDWDFEAIPGETFTDRGNGLCHGRQYSNSYRIMEQLPHPEPSGTMRPFRSTVVLQGAPSDSSN